ncbi:MAG: hypothetical protein ACOYO2_06820 [Mycobacterium sp.]
MRSPFDGDDDRRLLAAIESVYMNFADVARPTSVRGCPCCTDDAETCALLAQPLRDLSADDLDRYAWKAVTTMGTTENLTYFFPRLLELLVDDTLGAETEAVLAKMEYVYDTWPPPRQRAIDTLLETVLLSSLTRDRADAWICGAALGTTDAAARLAAALAEPDTTAGLARWAQRNTDAAGKPDLRNAYFSDEDPGAIILSAWLGRTDIRRALHCSGDGSGVIASENCLYTCFVDQRGRVLLDVEFEVHPGAASSLCIELTPPERRRVGDPAALRERAFDIGGSPESWLARRVTDGG